MSPTDSPDIGGIGAHVHQILLVDDEPQTADPLKDRLQQRGYRVTTATDGGQAQAFFVMHKPDFVILDLILPGESGFEVCDRFKHTDETVPILVLSVIDLPDAKDLARRAGADGYLTKPFDLDELTEQMGQIAQRMWDRTHRETGRRENPVRFSCRCGKRFKVSASHRGKSLTCPRCGEPIAVPKHD